MVPSPEETGIDLFERPYYDFLLSQTLRLKLTKSFHSLRVKVAQTQGLFSQNTPFTVYLDGFLFETKEKGKTEDATRSITIHPVFFLHSSNHRIEHRLVLGGPGFHKLFPLEIRDERKDIAYVTWNTVNSKTSSYHIMRTVPDSNQIIKGSPLHRGISGRNDNQFWFTPETRSDKPDENITAVLAALGIKSDETGLEFLNGLNRASGQPHVITPKELATQYSTLKKSLELPSSANKLAGLEPDLFPQELPETLAATLITMISRNPTQGK